MKPLFQTIAEDNQLRRSAVRQFDILLHTGDAAVRARAGAEQADRRH